MLPSAFACCCRSDLLDPGNALSSSRVVRPGTQFRNLSHHRVLNLSCLLWRTVATHALSHVFLASVDWLMEVPATWNVNVTVCIYCHLFVLSLGYNSIRQSSPDISLLLSLIFFHWHSLSSISNFFYMFMTTDVSKRLWIEWNLTAFYLSWINIIYLVGFFPVVGA